MNRIKIISLILASATLLAIALFSGCGELAYQGSPNVKSRPVVEWSDVIRDERNSRNPVLAWNGKDSDGKVLDNKFVVILDSEVTALGGPDAVAANVPASYEWTTVHEDSATVPLYASPDTSVYLEQYVFLKAMDDDSLYSNVIYKPLSRINHPPTCYVDVPLTGTVSSRRPNPQWCLPDTTASWKGIQVAWVGKDSIDIPGLQPDFDWNIRLYGPFIDSISANTLQENLYREFADSTGNVWIRDKGKKLTNLETGWYILYARCRDDAFVPSAPAIGYLVIYEPTWIRHPELTKKILLANHTGTNTLFGELPDSLRPAMWQFYINLLESAGYTTADFDTINFTVGRNEIEPAKANLYKYELVIVLDTDWGLPFQFVEGRDQHAAYAKYLDVGGKMWIIGRRTFEMIGEAGTVPFALNDPDRTLPNGYFNLAGAFAQSVRVSGQAEFNGAISAMEGFPNINVDTTRVAQTSTSSVHYAQALFGVDYLIRNAQSQTIYKFNSIVPDTSQFHNFPVAVRYEVPGSFKTSIFSFPLYFIRTDQAEVITQQMLDWFFEE